MERIWTKGKILERIRELHNSFGHRPTKYEVGSLYNIARFHFGSWGNALRCAGYEIKHLQKIELQKGITRKLAYFVGLVLSDGHIVFNKIANRYVVKLFTSYEIEKKMLLRLIKDMFKYIPTTRPRKYGFNKVPNYEIIISSRALAEFLINEFEIPFGRKSNKIRIPKIFFDNNLFLDLLHGIIDGDGGIDKDGVTIYSSSKEFLLDIKTILQSKFDIRTWNVSKSSKTVWYLTIPLNVSFKLYSRIYRKCEFYYPKLKEKWKENLLMYDRQSIGKPPVAQTELSGAMVERAAVA